MDIKLSKNNKLYIHNTDDVYDIMQRILRRENNIDREKGHLWIIGMIEVSYILYIELMALGTVRSVAVDLMNVFRVAVMKHELLLSITIYQTDYYPQRLIKTSLTALSK